MIQSQERGCRGEATVTEVVPSQTYGARQPRKLTWKERHCDLFITTSPDGTKSLRDWETLGAWEIVQ